MIAVAVVAAVWVLALVLVLALGRMAAVADRDVPS